MLKIAILDMSLKIVHLKLQPYLPGTKELTWIPAQMNDNTLYDMCDEITYLFLNVNGATIEVWKWMNNFISHFTRHVITYPCQGKS